MKNTLFKGNRLYILLFLGFITLARPVYLSSDYLSSTSKPYLSQDRYCGIYVVWHTLYHYGQGKPIDALAKEMHIGQKQYCSVLDIIRTLKANGIAAKAVKLDLERITSINKPFIPCLKGREIGHSVLCIPTGGGQIVRLDGIQEPIAYELAFIQNSDSQPWDGTAILIDGPERDGLYRMLFFFETISLFVVILFGLSSFVFTVLRRRFFENSKPHH